MRTLKENMSHEGRVPATKAIIYARISSKAQLARGDGLASQSATCREYAERCGYEVVEVFADTISGGTADRRAMEAMLAYLRKNRSKRLVVIVDHPNRFARDMRGHWDLRDLLTAAGGMLESPNMRFGTSPADILVENVIMSAAQYQRQQGAEQTKDRMRGRLLNGYWPFIPPRGMKHQRVAGNGNMLVPIEPEASVIAEALEGYASGRFASQAQVARFLTDHPDFDKRRSKKITDQQANYLLSNPLYGGLVEKLDWGITRRAGAHKGLVSYETFERVEARRTGKQYVASRTDVSADFPLRGSVTCGHCGKPLTACWSTSKSGVKPILFVFLA